MTTLEYRSASPGDPQTTRPIWLLWAIYLGMSWTWCIGMFLPVLLVRNFGGWGWVCFAIPNVLGAAAVGWINRTVEQSEKTVAAHFPMMTAFSWVTAAFQIFWGMWIFSVTTDIPTTFQQTMVSLAFLAVAIPSAKSRYGGLIVGNLVLTISLLCIWAQMRVGVITLPSNTLFRFSTVRPGLIGLTGATCFGFLLCPHLDLTFHRARQQISLNESQLAFGIGFGVVFLTMISFSLCYAVPVWMHLVDPKFITPTLLFPLCTYWMVQLAFTAGVHWVGGEVLTTSAQSRRSIIIAATSTLAGVLAWFVSKVIHIHDMGGPELVYRLFLAAYGLVFPGYVWLCMLPGRWIVAPDRRQWMIFIFVVIVAAPMFWMAFIEQKMPWALPGIGMVLLARLLIPAPIRNAQTVTQDARATIPIQQ